MATTIKLNLYLDIEPRPGQTDAEAANELATKIAEELTNKNGTLFKKFGAHPHDITHARNHPNETPENWGNTTGPFWTAAAITRQDHPDQPPVIIATTDN